jgi:hypothetical protein
MSIKKKTAVIGAVVAVALLAAGPAFAEGSTSGSFSNANPGFSSSAWTDHQYDSNSTFIDFVGCGTSGPSGIGSLDVWLVDQWGILPDAKVGPTVVASGCGQAAWSHGVSGYTLRDSTFFWQFDKINGSYSNIYAYGTANASW